MIPIEHTKIRVKPLEWVSSGRAGESVEARTVVGLYTVLVAGDIACLNYRRIGTGESGAQADYESRILSAIEPDPDACNAFDDLVAALKRVDASWTEAFPDGPDGSREYLGGIGVLSDDTATLWRDIRAALSRAGAA